MVDIGLTYALLWVGMEPWAARVPAIAVAMTYTWQLNRSYTFRVARPRSVDEAIRYGVVTLAISIINYLAYLGLVLMGVWPVLAVAAGTALQSVVSFFVYGHLVFGRLR